jgi:NTP pyrophosphatase (non-canonical NTP hydrolase)
MDSRLDMGLGSRMSTLWREEEMKRNDIFDLINNERDKQDKKWGALPRCLSDMVWLTVLLEEVGECAQAVLKRDWDNLKVEIIQVATVAIAWLEDDENHNNGSYKAG